MTTLALLAPRASAEPDLVVVGGVPGAGKSTAIDQTVGMPGVRVLDPDQLRSWLRGRLPARIRYAAYRPVVHTLQTLRGSGGCCGDRGPDGGSWCTTRPPDHTAGRSWPGWRGSGAGLRL